MLRRYLFLGNAPSADVLVAKYVALNDPANDASLTPNQQVIRAQQRALAASVDYMEPTQWCVVDTAELDDESKPVPEAAARFLAQSPVAVDRSIHYCDVELALAWLDRAIYLASTDEAIDAMPVPEQYARSTGAWDAYGKFWQALNVRPLGWDEHRCQWERVVRQLFHVQPFVVNAGADGSVQSTSERPTPYAKAPPGASVEQQYEALGPWRGPIARAYGVPPSTQVIVGAPQDVSRARPDETACGAALLTGCTSCLGPSGEVHRIWCTNGGRLACGITTQPSEIPEKWNYDAGASTNWRFTVATRAGGSLFFMPSMQQYLAVLRPLLAKLRARHPLALAREVSLNVQGKNAWTFYAAGKGPETLAAFAQLAESAPNRELDARRRLVTMAGSTAGLIALANPIAGAIVGLGAAALGIVNQLLPASGFHTTAANDAYGRPEPALEVFRFSDASERAQASIAEQYMPPPPPASSGMVPTPPPPLSGAPRPTVVMFHPTVDTISSVLANVVRVQDMPHYGSVEIGEGRREPSCSWQDTAQTLWRCTGDGVASWVRIEAPSKEARLALTDGRGGLSTRWAEMAPEHRLGVRGLPPDSHVYVDGAAAMGEWDGPAQSVWTVLAPVGSHVFRFEAPGEAPVSIPLTLAGPGSERAWEGLRVAALQAVSMEPMVELLAMTPPPASLDKVGGYRLLATNQRRYPEARWPSLGIAGLASDGRVRAGLAPDTLRALGAHLMPGAERQTYEELAYVPTDPRSPLAGRLVAVYLRGRGMGVAALPADPAAARVALDGLARGLYRDGVGNVGLYDRDYRDRAVV